MNKPDHPEGLNLEAQNQMTQVNGECSPVRPSILHVFRATPLFFTKRMREAATPQSTAGLSLDMCPYWHSILHGAEKKCFAVLVYSRVPQLRA